MILVLFVSGCISNESNNSQQNNDSDDSSYFTLYNLSIQPDDLPQGYVVFSVDDNMSGQFGFTNVIDPFRVMGITYAHQNGSSVTGVPMILVSIVKARNVSDAGFLISNSSDNVIKTVQPLFDAKYSLMNVSMGDEAFGVLFNGSLNASYDNQSAVWTMLYCRVDEYVFFVSLEEIGPGMIDYSQKTIDYMKIMLNRLQFFTRK